MIVPAGLFALLVIAVDRPELMSGWAVPCATDIAFSYMAARLIFPRDHPAIPFLLLLAIADDAMGLILLAIFYPSGPLSLLSFAALDDPCRRRVVLDETSWCAELLALRDRRRRAVMVGVVPRRRAPGARTGADPAVHATREARSRHRSIHAKST